MATAMDIRLDYGSWPDDEGDSTESATSREGSPAFYPDHQTHYVQQDGISQTHQSSLSLSDLFSDSGDTLPDQDLLDAEMNMVSFPSNPHIIPSSNSIYRGDGRNRLTANRSSTYHAPVIDLTESPPQPSALPNITTATATTSTSWATPRPIPQEQSAMPPTHRNTFQWRRASPASKPPLRTEERPPKRRRLSHNSLTAQLPQPDNSHEPEAEVEAVDLTEVNNESDLSKAISKQQQQQQQDAVQSQMKETQDEYSSGRTSLSSYKCPICMDTPEDATTTICGTHHPPPFPPPLPSPNLFNPPSSSLIFLPIQATYSATNASTTRYASRSNNAATTPASAKPKAPVPYVVSH